MPKRRKVYFVGIWCFIAALILVVLVCQWAGVDVRHDPFFILAYGIILIAMTLFWLACCRPLRCPKCRRFLRASPNRHRELEELYVCRYCQIEWDTGIPISDD